MRKIVLLISVILMLALVGAIGCSDSSSDDKASPEDTVRGFIAATQDMNPEKIAGFCTEDFAKGLGLENIEEITEGTTAKYSNISIEVVEQGEYDAVVNVSYDYQINNEGEDFSGNTAATVLLIKVDDSWLIDGDSSESAEIESPDEGYDTEMKNMKLAVAVLMADAGVSQLDADYFEVDTYEEVHNVTAGGGAYSIDDYLDISEGESLRQAYDIAKDGTVTVH